MAAPQIDPDAFAQDEGTAPEPSPANDPDARIRVAREFMCTDTGNAERFAHQFGDRVRYCHGLCKWFVWDGTRWAPDARAAVMGMTKEVVRSIYREASNASDDAKRKAIASWAAKSESRDKRMSLLALAQSEPGIAVTPEELDRDPWLLNTPTCTVDLRTGLHREHRREDMVTKCTAARFDCAARSDTWERVLSEAMGGDAALLAFFQRAAGYSIAGITSEEKLFLVHGDAGSGKSTIIQALIAALGDYAKTADFETFVQQRHAGGPRNDIARLAGSRLVASIEVDRGKRLAEGLVKTLTGGDVVTARFLYGESFEFRPTFTLWLVVNDAPIVRDDDSGMWRRILRLPLDHVVPVERRDPRVKDELLDVERSGPAVLAWLVSGCVLYRARGLGVPPSVTKATADLRDEQDPLRDFLADCSELAPEASCTRRELREAYEQWSAEAGGRIPLTGREFTDRIRRLDNVRETKRDGIRGW